MAWYVKLLPRCEHRNLRLTARVRLEVLLFFGNVDRIGALMGDIQVDGEDMKIGQWNKNNFIYIYLDKAFQITYFLKSLINLPKCVTFMKTHL